MVSNTTEPEVFVIIILPVSTSTASLKFSTISEFSATPVAPSVGVEEDKAGFIESPVVKSSVVFAEIPAYELPEGSSKAVASTTT